MPPYPHKASEVTQVDWLICAFATCFFDQNTVLIRSEVATNHGEPEFLPASPAAQTPAKICFAHGFFASALHEIAHWCIAGKKRRRLRDFGYWYIPDGRTPEQQERFEQVEVMPQALEWLFTLACRKSFQPSFDNLSASSSSDIFSRRIKIQACSFLKDTQSLPADARRWFYFLQQHIRPDAPVILSELD